MGVKKTQHPLKLVTNVLVERYYNRVW